jgi:hypothetical protein
MRPELVSQPGKARSILRQVRRFVPLFPQEDLVEDQIEQPLGVRPQLRVLFQVGLDADAIPLLPASTLVIQQPGGDARR